MMASWVVAGYCAWFGFTHPATKVVFQSQDKERAVNILTYVKVLWDQSIPELKAAWPLRRDVWDQAYDEFELANGSKFIGVVGDPDKVRSEHPSIVVFDEAAHIDLFERSFNVAVGTRVPRLIALSSIEQSPFNDMISGADPVDWPEYEKKAE